MRPIKAGVDLDGVEDSGVSLEVGADSGEPFRVLAPEVPAGAA
jgi:hypothetical protein